MVLSDHFVLALFPCPGRSGPAQGTASICRLVPALLYRGKTRLSLPVGRPSWALFANLGSVAQVDHLAAAARDGENIPQFVSSLVLLKHDPLAVRRPDFSVLSFV